MANAGRQYRDDGAAQTVGRVPGYCYRAGGYRADGDALGRLHRKGMTAIAEVIHKKWVEPILADNYQLQLPAAIPARAEALCE